MKAIADHGARFVGCNVMFLEGGTRDHFMRWLADEHPELVDAYGQLYKKKYAPDAYRKEVKGIFGLLRAKYGMDTRERYDKEHPTTGAAAEAVQQMLAWKSAGPT